MNASIVKLSIKNFLSISDVEIQPGKVNQIVGANNNGKTTVLKALQFAANGSTDAAVVKHGQDAAEVMVELSNGVTIRRRLSAAGKQSVKVKNGEGFEMPSPQTYLEQLFESSMFNPLELLEPKRRAEAILKSIDLKVTAEMLAQELGIDVEKLPPVEYDQHGLKVIDQAHKFFYQRRAEANEDVKEKRKRYETYKADLPTDELAPIQKLDELQERLKTLAHLSSEVDAEYNAAKSKMDAIAAAKSKADKYAAEIQSIKSQMVAVDKKYQDDLLALKNKYDKDAEVLTARLTAGQQYYDDVVAESAAQPPDMNDLNDRRSKLTLDTAKINEQMKGAKSLADAHASRAKQSEMVARMGDELKVAEAFAEVLTKRVDLLHGPLKRKLMAAAEMPVKDLEYVDGEFMIGGVPVENLSSSRALILALAVARKLAKKTKLICIDGAELVDPNTWQAMRDEMQDDGFTYFISKVDTPHLSRDGDKVFPMQNGQVVS